MSAKDVKPLFFLQYRDNNSLQLMRKLGKTCKLTPILTTRKLCICIPSRKSSFDSNLKPHVVYGPSCCGCNSLYVGQTCRHLATRISEHQKTNSPVGQHVVECCGALTAFNYKIIDQCQDSEKLMTIEALQISSECICCLKIFELPCEQRYIEDRNENLIKTHILQKKDSY